MQKLIPVAALGAVFVALGVADALKPATGTSTAARVAQARLDAVPLTLGSWAGETTTVPAKHLQIAEAQAHLSRTYTRGRSGPAVAVLMLFGDPGPLGAHTPETCYAGAGYRPAAPAAVHALKTPGCEFWLSAFETPAAPPAVLRVLWGWGAGDGQWTASANPRVDLAGPVYKLYAVRTVGAGPVADPDPADELLSLFLPAFDAAAR